MAFAARRARPTCAASDPLPKPTPTRAPEYRMRKTTSRHRRSPAHGLRSDLRPHRGSRRRAGPGNQRRPNREDDRRHRYRFDHARGERAGRRRGRAGPSTTSPPRTAPRPSCTPTFCFLRSSPGCEGARHHVGQRVLRSLGGDGGRGGARRPLGALSGPPGGDVLVRQGVRLRHGGHSAASAAPPAVSTSAGPETRPTSRPRSTGARNSPGPQARWECTENPSTPTPVSSATTSR